MTDIKDIAIGIGINVAVVFVAAVVTSLINLFDDVKQLQKKYKYLSGFVDKMNANPGKAQYPRMED